MFKVYELGFRRKKKRGPKRNPLIKKTEVSPKSLSLMRHTLAFMARRVPSVSRTLSKELSTTFKRSGMQAWTWGDSFWNASWGPSDLRGSNGRNDSLVTSLRASTSWLDLDNLCTCNIASSCLNTVCFSNMFSLSWRLQILRNWF